MDFGELSALWIKEYYPKICKLMGLVPELKVDCNICRKSEKIYLEAESWSEEATFPARHQVKRKEIDKGVKEEITRILGGLSGLGITVKMVKGLSFRYRFEIYSEEEKIAP